MLLGCIGDDFTGSSDLGNTLAKGGMYTVQYTGVPKIPAPKDVEAGVVALKSRSIPPKDAISQSLDALRWLQDQGCQQFFFKYCSTFDSTKEGNIGPVADALADALGADSVIVCPAFPGTGRSVYQGHLFVKDQLLNESGMQNHPLTPMVDADIRRWLGYQSDNEIGHVPADIVLAGAEAIRDALAGQRQLKKRLVVVDAINDKDLFEIGAASRDLALITGGSGVAMGLPQNFKAAGLISGGSHQWVGEAGKCVALSGSCSQTTRAQIAAHCKNNPGFEVDAAQVISGKLTPQAVVNWCLTQPGIPLVYSSADPDKVGAVQQQYGRESSAQALEAFFSQVAVQLVEGGTKRLLVAGGETSGAVIEGLDLQQLQIGPEIDPGVPAVRGADELVLALKSGNFGAVDYFEKAARVLGGE